MASLFSVLGRIPAVAAAITIKTLFHPIEVHASVFLGKHISLSSRLSHDPNIDHLILPIPVREHPTEISRSSPLRIIVATTAAVLRVNEFLHAPIITRYQPDASMYFKNFWL